MMINEQINIYILSIKRNDFFEAHEALESIWYPRRFEDNDEIRLIKGFINAAVSFELLKKGRKAQSKKVWKTYLKYKKLLCKIESPNLDKYQQLADFVEQKMESLICTD